MADGAIVAAGEESPVKDVSSSAARARCGPRCVCVCVCHARQTGASRVHHVALLFLLLLFLLLPACRLAVVPAVLRTGKKRLGRP